MLYKLSNLYIFPKPYFTDASHHMRFVDPAGELVVGWKQQADFLGAKYAGVPLQERLPQVMWRGRIKDPEHPNRDALRCDLSPEERIFSR